ncbi:uncharacterized protein [Euphorbia lathyris]|uniref:uncharacterized protein isoform X2 n=1 Tax=Euphorbia lathyris TaxID=212925 RepID=UPI003314420D
MELLQKAKVIRLRSYHDKYLIADSDEEHVTQDRNGTVRNARWTVELIEDSNVIHLKSCFEKYLTATNTPFLLGMTTGRKVLQTSPKKLDSSVQWEPIREGVQFKLKTRYGQYLRANSGLPPWRNHVTHDIPHRSSTQDWVLWDVDIVEIRLPEPPKPPPPSKPVLEKLDIHHSNRAKFESPPSERISPTAISLRSPPGSSQNEEFENGPLKNEGRVINYSVANEEGDVDENEKETLNFKGFSVEELKKKLEEETGLQDILVCSRNPLNGKLYPLRLHLPPNHVQMYLIVVPSSAKG